MLEHAFGRVIWSWLGHSFYNCLYSLESFKFPYIWMLTFYSSNFHNYTGRYLSKCQRNSSNLLDPQAYLLLVQNGLWGNSEFESCSNWSCDVKILYLFLFFGILGSYFGWTARCRSATGYPVIWIGNHARALRGGYRKWRRLAYTSRGRQVSNS